MKGLLALLLLLLPNSCTTEISVDSSQNQYLEHTAGASLQKALRQSYPEVHVSDVVYTFDESLIQKFQVHFSKSKAPSREVFQAVLIDYFTQKNHPEGSCVQVGNCSQGDNCFDVLVVCVS